MRPSTLSIPFLLIGAALYSAITFGGETTPAPTTPLDLPSGGFGYNDDEEDLPEAIHFFGSIYEGTGFFFLIDKSGSMNGVKMEHLKAELTAVIGDLSSTSQIGMVAFSSNIVPWLAVPVPASPTRRLQAIAWVQQLVPAGATHMLDGAMAILQITSQSSASQKIVICVGDGLPNSPLADETLAGILQANYEALPWNTILFGNEPSAVAFMQDLAASTGGSFESHPEE